jgi:hypothetical protein
MKTEYTIFDEQDEDDIEPKDGFDIIADRLVIVPARPDGRAIALTIEVDSDGTITVWLTEDGYRIDDGAALRVVH